MLKALCAALAAAVSLHAWSASDAPRLPCEGAAPSPAYAAPGAGPAVDTWGGIEWQAPACLGWPSTRYRFVTATAGRIDVASDEELRRRLGAISATKGLRYWSVTENSLRTLVNDAAALSGPAGTRRADFTADEIRAGAVLYFVEEDNRSSEPVTYRMRVLEATPERIVVETENATPIKSFVTLFPPETLRAAYFMTRIDARAWGLYAISAATGRASGLVSVGRESYANRAKALFAHFAGHPL